MQTLLRRLTLDHDNLKKMLVVLERQLDDFHAGQEHDLDLLCELVEYVASYEDQVHHPTEDLIFARLRELTDELGPVLETLEAQHRDLAQMSKRFAESLETIMHEGVVLREEVEAQGRAMVQALREHMDLEDGEAFPLAERRLGAGDWTVLSAAAPKAHDPVFGNPDPARFRTLFQHLSTELGLG